LVQSPERNCMYPLLSVGMSKTIRRLLKTVFKAWLNEEFGYD
jgi:hypothetical protein